MDMAADVGRDRVLGPLPVLQRLGRKLQLARGSGKTDMARAVDLNADRCAGLGDYAGGSIDLGFAMRGRRGFVGAINLVLDQKGAVLAHVAKRRQSLLGRGLG